MVNITVICGCKTIVYPLMLSRLLALFLITASVCQLTDNSTGICYWYSPDPSSWFDAYVECTLEGGDLAILNSDVIDLFVPYLTPL